MSQVMFGTKTFLKRTGLSTPIMRGLEVMEIIHPIRCDSGWRMFSEADIKAAIAWKARQPKSPRGGRQFGE